MVELLTALSIKGIVTAAAGGTAGNVSDRVYCGLVRTVQDRLAGLRGLPGNHHVALAVRTAQLQALEHVIRGYRATLGRPWWLRWMEPQPTRRFFRLSLAFCSRNIGRTRMGAVTLNPDVNPPLIATIDGILAPPAHDGAAIDRAAAIDRVAEDVVLDELREVLGSTPLPAEFEPFFRQPSGGFIDLFGLFIGEQLKSNSQFRHIFAAMELAKVIAELAELKAIAMATKEASEEGLRRLKVTSEEVLKRLELPLSPTAQAVSDYLEATGHRPASAEDVLRNDDDSTDLLLRDDTGATLRYCCVEGIATKHHVDRLRERLRHAAPAEAHLVTAAQILDGLAGYARKEEPRVRVVSLRDLVYEALELESYEKRLHEAVQERIEESCYIPPRFSISVDPALADPADRTIRYDLRKYLVDWLRSKDPVHTALLGEFGSGKTSFVLLWAKDLLAQFGTAPEDRLPVVLRAADRPAISSLADVLAEFHARCGGRLGEPAVFGALAEAGRLLVIFDGLDELVVHGVADPYRGLNELRTAITGDVRLLLTSRTSYFRALTEETGVMGQPGMASGLAVFRVLRLEPFDMTQVLEYLRRRVAPENLPRVQRLVLDTYGLPDLATRPILLEMILKTWTELDGREVRRVGDLYRLYTDQWFDAAAVGRPGALSREQRVDLMVSIALWMAETGETEMQVIALPDRLSECLGAGYAQNESVEREVRSQTFLVRNAQDRYYFAHRSFQEFFLALEVVREIERGEPRLLSKKALQPEVIEFTNVYDLEVARVLELLDATRADEESAVLNGNLLSILRARSVDFSGRDLTGLVAEAADLRGARFVGTQLARSRLHDCDVRDADFSGAVLTDAQLTGLILGVRSPAKCVRFRSGTGEVLASDGATAVLRLAVADDTAPERVHEHDDSVTCIAAGDDGHLVVSGGFDGRVLVTDLRTGSSSAATAHGAIVYGIAVRRDGRYIASTDAKGRLKIWDLEASQLAGDWLEHTHTAYSVDWSATGDLLATGSFDGTVCLWRFITEGSLRLLSRPRHLDDHGDLVNGVRLSPCGKFVAAASNNGSVRVWDVGTGEVLAVLAGQEGADDIEWAVSFSPGGDTLASAGSDGCIRLWDWRSGDVRASWKAHDSDIWTLDHDASGGHLASGSLDGSVGVWSPNGELVRRWDFEPSSHGLRVTDADLTGVSGLSGLQRRVLSQLGAHV